MNTEKQQRDHIILPHATLKRFANKETHMISVLHLSSPFHCEIKPHYPRRFHTDVNYYDVQVDKEVKKYETSIGEWNKRLSDALKSNDLSSINFNKLKEFAIRIITLQYHRSVMADPKIRKKFIKNKLVEYKSKLDKNKKILYEYKKIYLCSIIKGISIPNQFFKFIACLNKEIHYLNEAIQCFNEEPQNPKQFILFFQKNFLMNGNDAIENIYRDFKAVILFIPENVKTSFLLTPQHFVSVDNLARVIIGPKLAIGLYPHNFNSTIELSKDEVDDMIPRSIEMLLEMSEDYRQLVGNYTYLLEINNKIDMYRNIIQETANSQVLRIEIKKDTWDDLPMWIIVMLKYIKPNYKNIILEIPFVSEINHNDLLFGLKKLNEYQYNVAILTSSQSVNNIIPAFTNINKAIKYLIPD